MVETGCRPSEICNLTPDSIKHTDRVPHLVIRARTLGDLDWDAEPDVTANDEREAFEPRRLKTTDSARTVPLVGISLEVFKKYPNGFPRYFEGEVAASAAINNYLKDRKLRPTKNHTLYSLRHTFEDRLTRAGVPPIAPYSFRHLFAADLKADAVAKTVIAGALGHRSTATQKRYGTKKQGSSGGMTLVSVTHSNDIRDPDRSFPGTKRVPAPEADDLGMDMTSP
jgi:integrase